MSERQPTRVGADGILPRGTIRRSTIRFGCLIGLLVGAATAGPVLAQAPCTASAPECNGQCDVGEECVNGEIGGECLCVPTANPCTSSVAPECDGDCGPEQSCDDIGGTCVCVDDPDPACGATSPTQECGGACPVGLQCVLDESGAEVVCSCQPPLVACGIDDPLCDGMCPQGEICQSEVGAGCVCVPGSPCGDASDGECDGFCASDGFRCVYDGADCSCQPVDVACSGANAPICDGSCPDGMLCAESAVGGCSCQTLPCSGSPFPECAGDCPADATCRSNSVTLTCDCESDSVPCSTAVAPECGGDCPLGSACQLDPTGGTCLCVPFGAACGEALAPVCEGECPVGQQCEQVVPGLCGCVTPPSCGDTIAPECGGTCNQGEICIMGILGDCICEPLLTDCEDAATPVCNGSCPDGYRCEPDDTSGACSCQDCALAGLVPAGVVSVVWTAKDELRWSAVDCAAIYNVYRKEGPFVDADGDGAAEDYGDCLEDGLSLPVLVDPQIPPSHFVTFRYLATAESPTGGEGPLGMSSSGAPRPNASPCP